MDPFCGIHSNHQLRVNPLPMTNVPVNNNPLTTYLITIINYLKCSNVVIHFNFLQQFKRGGGVSTSQLQVMDDVSPNNRQHLHSNGDWKCWIVHRTCQCKLSTPPAVIHYCGLICLYKHTRRYSGGRGRGIRGITRTPHPVTWKLQNHNSTVTHITISNSAINNRVHGGDRSTWCKCSCLLVGFHYF